MQRLARDGLTDAQVRALLHGALDDVSAGCEVLSSDLTFAEDISDDLVGGRVARNMASTIHGTVTLSLSRRLTWGVDLVRPYMVLTGSGVTARFNLGVFALTTPLSVIGEDPQTYEVQGYDRLYLLSRQVGATYTASKLLGDGITPRTYRQALLDVFAAAGLTGVLIEGSAADSTLPQDRTWALVGDNQADPDQTSTPVTYLRIVNDLLRAISFRAVWVDEDGRFRCGVYQDPGVRPSEFTFDADDILEGIVGEDRTVSEDVWAIPNRWVFRWTNPPEGTATADLTYERLNQSDGPTSIDSRGLTWTSVVDYEAASRAALVSLGDNRVASDRRKAAAFKLTTGPFPCAGHADVFTYSDAAAGVSSKVQAESWDMPLDGSDVQWTWKAVR